MPFALPTDFDILQSIAILFLFLAWLGNSAILS